MISVFVKELKFRTIIGLLEFERDNLQEIVIDAEFKGDEFIDYAVVCNDFKRIFNEKKFEKVEESLIFFKDFFKMKFNSLKLFKMSVKKTEIMPDAVVGASIKYKY